MDETRNIEAIIESILFAAGYPVSYIRLADVLTLTEKEVKDTVKEYAQQYNKEGIARGVQLIMYDDSCQLCTKEEYQGYIKEALGIKKNGTLSNSSLEVLAVIAYHQPVTKAYIEQIRGVDCTYSISNLIDKKLIEVRGRLDVPGKPYLYGTTPDFLRCFGLSSLDDLPPSEMFSAQASDSQIELDVEG